MSSALILKVKTALFLKANQNFKKKIESNEKQNQCGVVEILDFIRILYELGLIEKADFWDGLFKNRIQHLQPTFGRINAPLDNPDVTMMIVGELDNVFLELRQKFSNVFENSSVQKVFKMLSDELARISKATDSTLGKRAAILDKPIQLKDLPAFSKDNTPSASVISCSFNLMTYLDETLKTIALQSHKSLEYIVVDAASKDGSVEKLKANHWINHISEPDSGYPDGFNKGIALSRGEIIFQCCISDGYLNEEWVAECVKFLNENPDVSMVWGFPQYLSETGILEAVSFEQFFINGAPQKTEMFYHWLETGFHFPEGNMAIRKSVLRECYASMDEVHNEMEPWLEFNFRFHTKGYLSAHLPLIANFGRKHAQNAGSNERASGIMNVREKNYKEKWNSFTNDLVSNGGSFFSFVNYKGEKLPVTIDRNRLNRVSRNLKSQNSKFDKIKKMLSLYF